MKTFRWIMIVFVSICFVVGMTSITWSAPKQPKLEKKEGMPPLKPKFTQCPEGWHKKFKQGYHIYCVPDKPKKPINCPKGTIYIETDCVVGCKPLIK